MKRKPLRGYTRLRPISERRRIETKYYLARLRQFLAEHPYCQVWLRENAVEELDAIRLDGRVGLDGPMGKLTAVPLATQIHHRDKRRGSRLLDTSTWMAVSKAAHTQIETNKGWARARGYLSDF